jgi:ABC-type polysaccharide/polyol phosphate transport system ATPase subunit/polysaccharide pyruvyl transferase WcaK-like protein
MTGVITVSGLNKTYRMYDSPGERLKEVFRFKKKRREEFLALKDISFNVARGESLGIIGKNGSGKSTLLHLVCGIIRPTSGQINIDGRVSALLELGAGFFNSELTGRANVYINGALMGFTREEMDARIADIESFAEIGGFIDRPMRVYSGGMYVRLVFACAINVNPDILIIDEALSVGDVFFQQKCFSAIRRFISNGTACLIVSHDMSAITSLCHRVMVLNGGEIDFIGSPRAAAAVYYSMAGNRGVAPARDKSTAGASVHAGPVNLRDVLEHNIAGAQAGRHGAGGFLQIAAVRVTGSDGSDTLQVPMTETLTFYVLVRANETVIKNPDVGLKIFDRTGNTVFAAGTGQLRYRLPDLEKSDEILVRLALKMDLYRGEYTFGVFASEFSGDGSAAGYLHDKIEALGPIVVTLEPGEPIPFFGIAKLHMEADHCVCVLDGLEYVHRPARNDRMAAADVAENPRNEPAGSGTDVRVNRRSGHVGGPGRVFKRHLIYTGLGAGNIGDEAMLHGFLALHPLPEATTVEVLDDMSPALKQFPPGLKFVNYRDREKCEKLCLESDAVLIVGTTIVTEMLNLDWPLRILGEKYAFCHRNGIPCSAVGVGVDRLRSPGALELFKEGFLPISSWTVRAQRSFQNLVDMGVAPERVGVGSDLAWLTPLEFMDAAWAADYLRALGILKDVPLVGVNVVNEIWKDDVTIKKELAAALDTLINDFGWQVAFFCNETREGEYFDKEAALHVASLMKNASVVVPNRYFSPHEMISLLSCCHVTLSWRYHFTLFSCLAGAVPVSVIRGEKLLELVEDICAAHVGAPLEARRDVIVDRIGHVRDNYCAMRARQDVQVEVMRRRCRLNTVFLRNTGSSDNTGFPDNDCLPRRLACPV